LGDAVDSKPRPGGGGPVRPRPPVYA